METEARLQLAQAFTRVGWTVEDLHQDYGEDLLVRIFKDRKATPLSFFVQSKSTKHIQTAGGPGGWASIRIRVDHLRQWASFAVPVFVTLYDAVSGVTYWENVEYFIEHDDGREALRTRQKTVSFRIPWATCWMVMGSAASTTSPETVFAATNPSDWLHRH